MTRSWSTRVVAALLVLGTALPALAQSQAINGNIEGTVKDSSGAALPGVTVTVTNTDTGAQRVVITRRGRLSRPAASARPLRRHRRAARASRSSSRGHHAVGRPDGASSTSTLAVGNVSETITVTSESPIAKPGKIDLGRTIGETEIQNLPLVSRNPYNFAFLQANVTGYENNEFGVPRINANGIADAHQLPARRQHQHREGSRRPAHAAGLGGAGARGEGHHQRLRAGVRPDHRHGLQRDHAVGHQRLPRLGELPLQAQSDVGAAVLPGADGAQARHRGQRRDRDARRADPEGQAALLRRLRVRRPQPDHRRTGDHGHAGRTPQALGITLPASGVIPAHQKVNFGFGKIDYQINAGQLAVGALLPLQELLAVEHRRRPDHHRSRDRLHRSHGLGVGAAGLDHRAAAC